MTNTPQTAVKRMIEIELLALDLTTCGRCTGTARNLADAIDTVANVLRETGTGVRVTRHVVTSAEQAEQLRFAASPTIRVDGRDIALEFKQSSCKDCGDLCGCDGGVDCRVWIWNGQEHLEAPKGMLIDALLKAYANGPAGRDTAAYRLPENLRRFFAQAAVSRRTDATLATGEQASDCCDRTTCCSNDAKAGCCEDGTGKSEPLDPQAVCGCK